MSNQTDDLIPPLSVIHDRMTRVEQERKLLRSLLRIAVEHEERRKSADRWRDQPERRATR